jgi:large subunit ribosomal protein L25
MELQTINTQTRTQTGKGPARQARMAGQLPGVLYGENKDSVPLLVNAKELNGVLQGQQGEHALLQVTVEDAPDMNGPAMIKEIQHHPVRGHVMHADFMRISMDKKIHTLIPVKFEGHPAGIVEGGVLDHQLREVEIECLPLDVPEFIVTNITHLEIGDSLHVADLEPGDEITILTESDRTIAAIHQPRVVKADTAAEEGEEAVEDGEAATAEGGDEAAE